MRLLVIAAILSPLECLAQQQVPPVSDATAITIPAGTKISLQILDLLWTKEAKAGDSIRGITTFPVANEQRIVIPAGIYFEGVITAVKKRGREAGITAHFNRVLLLSGNAVKLDGIGDVRAARLGASLREWPGPAEPSAALKSSDFPVPPPVQSPPALSQPSTLNSHLGLAAGLGAATTAALVVTALVLSRRGSYLYLAPGWPMEIVLRSPLSLDVDKLPPGSLGPGWVQ